MVRPFYAVCLYVYLKILLILIFFDKHGICQTLASSSQETKTVVEGERTSLVCDISVAGDNDVNWGYVNNDGRLRYISSNEFVYPCNWIRHKCE